MLLATEAPLEVARAAASVAQLASDVAERGNTNAVADAAVAALLAESVCKAALLTVRVNVIALNDPSESLRLKREAVVFVSTASAAATRAVAAAERAC
jgi:formiminotetrahydrofolate cyclodeaminase